MKNIPQWVTELAEEDLNFIKRFVLSSGSLKEMARIYNVTYPTVRSRLDRVIRQILSADEKKEDAYVNLIKKMVLDEKLEFDAAMVLIREYQTLPRSAGQLIDQTLSHSAEQLIDQTVSCSTSQLIDGKEKEENE